MMRHFTSWLRALLAIGLLLPPFTSAHSQQVGFLGGCERPNSYTPDHLDGDNDECPYAPPDGQKSLGGNSDDDANVPRCQEGQSCGNPINATTGNKYQAESDYAGAGTFPLVFDRFYNSQANSTIKSVNCCKNLVG